MRTGASTPCRPAFEPVPLGPAQRPAQRAWYAGFWAGLFAGSSLGLGAAAALVLCGAL